MSSNMQPLTIENFDNSNITLGKCANFPQYGFKKYNIGYKRAGTTEDTCFIRLCGLKVANIFEPAADAKAPKYSVSFAVEDEKQIQFLDTIQHNFRQMAVDHNEAWFGDATLTAEDLEGEYKPFCKKSDKNGKYYLTVKMSFNNPKDRDPVIVHYYQNIIKYTPINRATATAEQIENEERIVKFNTELTAAMKSKNLIDKLPRGTTVDIFLQLTDVKINSTNKFDVQTGIYKRINVTTLSGDSDGEGGPRGPSAGMPYDSINTSMIVMGDIVTGTLPTGASTKCLRPKYKLAEAKGDKTTRNLSIQLDNVRVSFLALTDKTTEKVNFNAVYVPSDETHAKFKEIEDYLKADMIANHAKYVGGKTTAKVFEKKWNSFINNNEKYGRNMWFTVYVKTHDKDGKKLVNADGEQAYDFSGNFYKADKTPYTNEEVLNRIFTGKDLQCSVNVYLKHIWFSEKGFSPKFMLGNAVLDVDTVKYDLGPEMADREAEPENVEGGDELAEEADEAAEAAGGEEYDEGPADSDGENAD